jgi:rRNA maturation protein Nop10
MKPEPDYPSVICADCGKKHGRRPEGNKHATWYPGTCDICGSKTNVTEPRDYGHVRDNYPRHNVKQDRQSG